MSRKITKIRVVLSTLLVLVFLSCGISGFLMDFGHQSKTGSAAISSAAGEELPAVDSSENFRRGKGNGNGNGNVNAGIKEFHKISGYLLIVLAAAHFGLNFKMYLREIKA